MKRLLLLFVLLSGSMKLIGSHEVGFDTAPYGVGQSIIGINGWEPRQKGAEAKMFAKVVNVRWDHEKPALMLKGVSLKNTETRLDQGAGELRFSCELAFNFNGRIAPERPFRIAISGTPFSEIFFDRSEKGGFGFAGDGTGRSGGTIMVPRDELKPNSFYHLTTAVDYSNGTYTVELTGTRKDGTPLHYQSGEQSFEVTPAHRMNLGQISYLLSAQDMTLYLRSFSLK